LSDEARSQGMTDTEWARRAEVRKETLSRLRARESCDFATLQRLADAVGKSLAITSKTPPDGFSSSWFPAHVDRDFEERLADLCASGDFAAERWRSLGSSFFMAGLAVMVASARAVDRRELLELAERLHPGASQVGVFALWLERSPVRPSRFLPLLASYRNAA
jgi:hypothetical protein